MWGMLNMKDFCAPGAGKSSVSMHFSGVLAS